MASLLVLGPLRFDQCRATIANFFARQTIPVRFIQVRLVESGRIREGLKEWRAKEDDDLSAIAGQIASHIAERRSEDATIHVRRPD